MHLSLWSESFSRPSIFDQISFSGKLTFSFGDRNWDGCFSAHYRVRWNSTRRSALESLWFRSQVNSTVRRSFLPLYCIYSWGHTSTNGSLIDGNKRLNSSMKINSELLPGLLFQTISDKDHVFDVIWLRLKMIFL